MMTVWPRAFPTTSGLQQTPGIIEFLENRRDKIILDKKSDTTTTSKQDQEQVELRLPVPEEKTLSQWKVVKKHFPPNRSSGWMATLERFLGFLDLPVHARWRALDELRVRAGWRWTTTDTYWGAICAAAKLLHRSPDAPAMREASAFFAKKAAAEIPAYPSALDSSEFRNILAELLTVSGVEFQARLAICISFLFGQRLPDILQLQTEDVERIEVTGSVCITVRRGKVIRWVQPYCLHLKADSLLASALEAFATQREPYQPMFDCNVLGVARDILKLQRNDLEIRSVRRGGLQALALLGVDIGELRRHYSKHSTDAMLLRYLSHGSMLTAQVALHHHTTQALLDC